MNALSSGDQVALDALRVAVKQALERKWRLGQYAVIWRDGRVVRVEAEELAVLVANLADGCTEQPAAVADLPVVAATSSVRADGVR